MSKIQINVMKPYFETPDGMVKLYHADCFDVLPEIPIIDCVMTDPPYMYMKTDATVFDLTNIDFNRLANLFAEKLTDVGFIGAFGRGMMLAKMMIAFDSVGFKFKESICWDKRRVSSPCHRLLRVHEDCVIFSRSGVVRHSVVPYLEKNRYEPNKVIEDVRRLKTVLCKNGLQLNKVEDYLKTGVYKFDAKAKIKDHITVHPGVMQRCRAVALAHAINEGFRETDLIQLHVDRKKRIHPTEKPVRLIERILAIISDKGDTILDPFAGSGSTGIACIRTGRKAILIEKDPKFCDLIVRNIKNELKGDNK